MFKPLRSAAEGAAQAPRMQPLGHAMYLSGAAAVTEFAANVPRTEALQVICATCTTAFPPAVAEQVAQLQAEADWELQVPDELEPPEVSGSRLVTNEQPVLETGQPPAPVATSTSKLHQSRAATCTSTGIEPSHVVAGSSETQPGPAGCT